LFIIDLEEFQKKKKSYFSVLISAYTTLFILLVILIKVDYILFIILTSGIAVILGLYSIAHKIEGKIDNLFFRYRQKIDDKIVDFMRNIWHDKDKNKNCEGKCEYLIENQCKVDENVFQEASMGCFYKIIKDDRFKTTRSFIFEGFLYYWVFMFILFLAIIYTLAFELTLLIKIYFGLIQGDFQYLLCFFILQVAFFGLFLILQIIRNKTKKNNKILTIFIAFKSFIFLIFIVLSLNFLYLIVKENIGIESNLYLTYYIILMISYLIGLSGKGSRRVIEYIEPQQIEQLRLITDMEDDNNQASNCLIDSICKKDERERYITK